MSRAFVKDRDDNAPETAVPLQREPPHLVTVRGKAQLEAAVAAASGSERARLERRLASAAVASPPHDRVAIAFGATVAVREPSGRERTFSLVGEDEVDIASGRVTETSPLGAALLGRCAGDVAVWQRPVGDESLTVLGVSYEALEAH